MKQVVIILLLCAFFSSCSKNRSYITGTVMAQPSCHPNAWLVQLDHPNPKFHSFICGKEISSISSATTNCGNSVFIIDMPAALTQAGKKVKFSIWEDKGLLCSSSSMAPHHLEVSDLSEQ